MNEETFQFIALHLQDNVHQLALQSRKYPLVDMPFAIRQINGKQKIKLKIPTFYNNNNILYPVQLSLEQSSSESTANYKSSLCKGNRLIDLTGGFGVDCSFMSRNFEQAIYVERQAELCKLAVHNFIELGLDNIRVIHADTENYLVEMPQVDWIYIDPARRSSAGKKVVLLSDCEPNVASISGLLLSKANQVLIKLSPMMDISAAVSELPNTAEIHIISIENECKEVLLLLDQKKHENRLIKTINFGRNNRQELFSFYQNEETNAVANYSTTVQSYLYEPNTAIMKSGGFKLTSERFNLLKLHINTHLFTSSKLLLNFPGRVFEVQNTWKSSKKELKELIKKLPKANISTRNYPLSVEELRKKLKIKEGGENYLFACTLANEEKVIIECLKSQKKA